jgi:hypothetical protein
VVSDAFAGKVRSLPCVPSCVLCRPPAGAHWARPQALVQRHRMVYGLLADEFQQGLHALSIVARTPAEAAAAAAAKALVPDPDGDA